MSISSAKPAELDSFVTKAGSASSDLGTKLRAARVELDAYLAAPNDYPLTNGNAVMGDAETYHQNNVTDENFVKAVSKAFKEADSGSTVVTLDDTKISAALNAAGISETREEITVDSPVFQGKPLMSGWSDDPVCTATGHFLEVEDDFAMPESLSVLRWTRTYSSRFVSAAPQGRGWASWASASLIESDGEVAYRGPDGQEATFVTDGDGFAPNPGVEATMRRTDEGLELRWEWIGRFPGMVWEFDRAGRVRTIRDARGRVTVCDYDDDGLLLSLTDQGGRRLDLVWDGQHIVEIESSDGRKVRYDYAGDDLISVERAIGSQRYTVDDGGRILEIHDADGVRLVANTYDEGGRVVTQTSPYGRVTHYRYLVPNTVVVGDDQGGPRALYRHDRSGRLVDLHAGPNLQLSRHFDRHGNPVRTIDGDGGVTEREFDVRGNCVREHRPDGTEVRWQHDEQGRVVSHTDANGAEFSFGYQADEPGPSRVEGPLGWWMAYDYEYGYPTRCTDADGVSVQLEYDDDGCVVATTDGLGNVTRYCHHPSGQPAAIQLATGDELQIDYDDAGRAVGVITPTGARFANDLSDAGRLLRTVGPGGQLGFEVGWGRHGDVASLTDGSGTTRSYEHDILGNLVAENGPGGQWQYRYDGLGQHIQTTDPLGSVWAKDWTATGQLRAVTDPTGNRTSFEFDEAGRLATAVSPTGERTRLRYDERGMLVGGTQPDGSEVEIRRNLMGWPTEVLVNGDALVRYVYTRAGRVASVVLSDGGAWSYHYDEAGRVTEVALSGEVVERYERDALGRVVRRTSPAGVVTEIEWGPLGLPVAARQGRLEWRYVWDEVSQRPTEIVLPTGGVQRFRYNGRGDLVEVTDPAGAVTRLEYDDQGNRVAVVDPKGARWSCQPDQLGQCVSVTDPLGQTSRLQRDAAGRVSALVASDGRIEVHHDADGRLTALAPEGEPPYVVEPDVVNRRVRTLTSDGSTVVYEWDRQGRLVRRDVDGRTTRWTYDDHRGLTTVTPPDGRPIELRTDRFGRLASVRHPVAGTVELSRDADGRLLELRADGVRRMWTYNAGQLVGYREVQGDDVTETRLERDDAGRVVAEHRDGHTYRYRYDVAGQLVGFDEPSGTWGWTYDTCGRVTEEHGPGGDRHFLYNEADELVRIESGEDVTELEYDRAGRRVAERGPLETVRYRWDSRGRLARVERETPQGLQTTELAVSVLGELLAVGGSPVEWLPGGPLGDQPLAVGDRTALCVDGMPVALVDGDRTSWLSADWRGTAGDQPWPWGASTDPSSGQPGLGFRGELEIDGLVWLRNRLYDPATHAFLSRDPAVGLPGYPGGLTNPYQYANNDPVGWLDPLGLHPLTVDEANKQIQGWKQGHWKQVAMIGGAIFVGTVLIVATGGTGAALVGAGAGVLIGGGSNAVSQYLTTGHVDWWKVGVAGATGYAGGALGGFVAGLPSATSGGLPAVELAATRFGPTAAKVAPWMVEGAVASGSSSAMSNVANGDPIDKDLLLNTALGMPAGVAGKYASEAYSARQELLPKLLRETVPPKGFRSPEAMAQREAMANTFDDLSKVTGKMISSTVSNGIKTPVKVVTTPSGKQVYDVKTGDGITWQYPAN